MEHLQEELKWRITRFNTSRIETFEIKNRLRAIIATNNYFTNEELKKFKYVV